LRFASVADVRRHQAPVVSFGPQLRELKSELEAFLRERVYCHHRVLRMGAKGQRFIKALFAELTRSPQFLPPSHLQRWNGTSGASTGCETLTGGPSRLREAHLERVVGDYLAGMTDRFAQQEYLRLFHPDSDS
jgi:dGTPase